MKCEHIRKNILDMDGMNTFPEDEKMKRHLENCKECQTFYQEIQQSWNLLDDIYILEPQTDFNASVWGKIQDRRSRSWWHISSLSFASPALRAAACAVVLVIGLAVVYVAFYSPQPEPVVFTSADQEDHQMLMELDELLKFDESQFLSIYQDWDLAKESNEEKETSSPSYKDEKTPENLNQSFRYHSGRNNRA